MKRIGIIIYLLLFILGYISAQQKNSGGNNIKELMEIEWNTEDGIYVQDDPSGRYGLTGFEIINENEMAVLCSFEKKVKIFNIKTGLLSYQFEIKHPIRRFTFDSKNQKFYISADYKIYEYSITGDLINQFEYNKSFLFVWRLVAIEGNLYLLTSNNKSFQLTINGIPIPVDEQKSSKMKYRIWDNSTFVRVNSIDKHNFNIIVNDGNFDFLDTQVNRSENIGSVFFIGKIDQIYYIMLSNLINENPIKTEQKLLLFSAESKSIVKEIEIPNIYYTNLRHGFKVRNGNLYHLLTTPENATLIKICSDSILTKNTTYPDKYKYEYHYNLDKSGFNKRDNIEKKKINNSPKDTLNKSSKFDPTNSHIMGSQIVDRAFNYLELVWIATENNITDDNGVITPDGMHIHTPDWVTIGDHNGTPYKWNGFTHFDDFVYYVNSATPYFPIYAGDETTSHIEVCNFNANDMAVCNLFSCRCLYGWDFPFYICCLLSGILTLNGIFRQGRSLALSPSSTCHVCPTRFYEFKGRYM